jgi:hypothetical protein
VKKQSSIARSGVGLVRSRLCRAAPSQQSTSRFASRLGAADGGRSPAARASSRHPQPPRGLPEAALDLRPKRLAHARERLPGPPRREQAGRPSSLRRPQGGTAVAGQLDRAERGRVGSSPGAR